MHGVGHEVDAPAVRKRLQIVQIGHVGKAQAAFKLTLYDVLTHFHGAGSVGGARGVIDGFNAHALAELGQQA